MSSIINTNSLSMLTQNNLNKSQGALNSAIERLSSGMRINSAKDDSAGQAVANRLTATIKGLTQATRNASDGISMTQTTESALGEVNNNLQRVRELAVQSANGSNSQVDRASMQAEITQRLDEINRLSKETDFNGTKVLSADTDVKIQVGSKDGETIGVALKKMDTTTLGLSNFSVSGRTSAMQSISTTTGTVTTTAKIDFGDGTAATKIAGMSAGTAVADLKIYGYNLNATTGVPANYAVEDKAGNVYGGATIDATTGIVTLDIADATKAATQMGVYAAAVTAGQAATSKPLEKLDAALAKVDNLRGLLGAVQNRFDSTIANLGTTIVNVSSTRSRIEDADYAVEVSNMSRAQILQQAGTSVLAKANQSTEGVMSLLR